ncbi:cytochrome P450 [Coprinellus micaceus]|uniref:Cytochrome P450 n=1 Tax=Coprinellus micaceus TaxID=71717 RepID=A0A4Y7U147_COPMI|nr:cytochrome P450 [Coprinellus micaceus]
MNPPLLVFWAIVTTARRGSRIGEHIAYSILNLQHLTDRRGAIPFVSPPPFSGKPFGQMATILLAAVCKLAFDTWRVLRSITLPYRIVFFGPKNMVINHYLPRIPWISMGNSWASDEKHTGYRENGLDVLVTVSFWPRLVAVYQVADSSIAKAITAPRTPFLSPVEDFGALLEFGRSIFSTEGAEWKMQRRVCAPAFLGVTFLQSTNRLVWSETVRICNELYEEVWEERDQIDYDHIVSGFSLPIALQVLCAASWGRRISWNDEELPGEGKKFSFKEAICVVSENMALKTALPRWAFDLTEGLRDIQRAFDDLRMYILEMVEERRALQDFERHDLFSKMLASCDEEVGFTEDDLFGNLFTFTLAGHGTTANTLAFALGLLALHPDEQEKLYNDIMSVVPQGSTPTYDDMTALPRILAVYYETLRLYAPSPYIMKRSPEDAYFTVTNQVGEPNPVCVPAGSWLFVSFPALHYNEHYWDRPTEFVPDRFMGDWPKDAFVPFSQGARACLGRKFFETEGVAILATLLPKYKVSIKEEPEFAHETFEERKARVLAGRMSVMYAPIRLPITFTRRDAKESH